MHTKPCRAGLPTFPLIIISLDDFCCLAIDSQATTHFFYKLSSTFSIFVHAHTTLSPPLTWGCQHTPHSIGTPLHHPLALIHHCPSLPHQLPSLVHQPTLIFMHVCTCTPILDTQPSTFPLPSTHLPGIPALVPRGAKCTAGMASWLCLALHGLGPASCIQCGTFCHQTHAKPC